MTFSVSMGGSLHWLETIMRSTKKLDKARVRLPSRAFSSCSAIRRKSRFYKNTGLRLKPQNTSPIKRETLAPDTKHFIETERHRWSQLCFQVDNIHDIIGSGISFTSQSMEPHVVWPHCKKKNKKAVTYICIHYMKNHRSTTDEATRYGTVLFKKRRHSLRRASACRLYSF